MCIYSTCCSRNVLSPLKHIYLSVSIRTPCSVRWQRAPSSLTGGAPHRK